MWNRFFNSYNLADTNIPLDLAVRSFIASFQQVCEQHSQNAIFLEFGQMLMLPWCDSAQSTQRCIMGMLLTYPIH